MSENLYVYADVRENVRERKSPTRGKESNHEWG